MPESLLLPYGPGVAAARAVQASRFGDEPEVHCNAQMTPRLMRLHCALGKESSDLLHNAMTRFDMSARAYDRILKVARTIADLEAAANCLPLWRAGK